MKFFRARNKQTQEYFTTEKRRDGLFHNIGALKSAFSTSSQWRGSIGTFKWRNWDEAKDDWEIIEYILLEKSEYNDMRHKLMDNGYVEYETGDDS